MAGLCEEGSGRYDWILRPVAGASLLAIDQTWRKMMRRMKKKGKKTEVRRKQEEKQQGSQQHLKNKMKEL